MCLRLEKPPDTIKIFGNDTETVTQMEPNYYEMLDFPKRKYHCIVVCIGMCMCQPGDTIR